MTLPREPFQLMILDRIAHCGVALHKPTTEAD